MAELDDKFEVHPQLVQDTFYINDLNLSRVLLMNDSRFPWVILVPRKKDLKELYDLEAYQQSALISEISYVSKAMQAVFLADKMNVAALGNIVPQLHVHIIARKKDDVAWPRPIWGRGEPIPYSKLDAEKMINTLIDSFECDE